jgi:hypothetical protein
VATLRVTAVCVASLTACGSETTAAAPAECAIPLEQFFDAGAERTQIPSLINPKLARRGTPDIAYLTLSDRVIGFMFNGQPVAIPHKFLWHHEVVNMEIPGEAITVTYSPLTGSSAVYNRTPSGLGPLTISNYVLHSGLVLEDEGESLRPQMATVASCGSSDGSLLARVPFEERTLGSWIQQHLDTWVASSATGLDILYTLFPHGSNYRDPANTTLIYPVRGGVDPRRPPKELTFGIRSGTGGVAFSLTQLDQLRGAINVVVSVANAELDGQPVAVFWNAAAQAATAYVAEANGQRLHFELVDGQRQDVETGSVWNFAGQAVLGPMAGAELEPIADTITAYWFAWAAFQPDTDLWTPPLTASMIPVAELVPPSDDMDWALSTR